mmetsp:Transcript_99574/g.171447  ORF Transcript_99574/g.171447 Transcript_99574/m.171447 type:complete len:247 (-) Transcript_99574:1231-1971(-)
MDGPSKALKWRRTTPHRSGRRPASLYVQRAMQSSAIRAATTSDPRATSSTRAGPLSQAARRQLTKGPLHSAFSKAWRLDTPARTNVRKPRNSGWANSVSPWARPSAAYATRAGVMPGMQCATCASTRRQSVRTAGRASACCRQSTHNAVCPSTTNASWTESWGKMLHNAQPKLILGSRESGAPCRTGTTRLARGPPSASRTCITSRRGAGRLKMAAQPSRACTVASRAGSSSHRSRSVVSGAWDSG